MLATTLCSVFVGFASLPYEIETEHDHAHTVFQPPSDGHVRVHEWNGTHWRPRGNDIDDYNNPTSWLAYSNPNKLPSLFQPTTERSGRLHSQLRLVGV